MDAIRIANLVKKYGTVVAVENLSLEVPKGSMFGFLGPNRSGRAPPSVALTGLERTAGAIEILGQPFTADSAAIKQKMGVMPETLGLFEPLYAHEFLAFIGRMFGLDEGVTRQREANCWRRSRRPIRARCSRSIRRCANAWPSRRR
jgi:ABC-2 type transport system ATP-binding protein